MRKRSPLTNSLYRSRMAASLDGKHGRAPTGASGQAATKTTPLSQIKAKELASCNVKLNDDKSDCHITGIAITNDGRRLLTDYRNKKIKMFSRDMKSLCSLSMSTSPWDIAVTGDREAVVSCDQAKLLTLDISDRMMSIKRTVELPFAVWAIAPYQVDGIAPYQDKLLVTALSPPTSPSSVKLIDLTGRVYWSTPTHQQGRPLFSRPEYVTCYDDRGSTAVIVSDFGNDTLTVLNADTGYVITRRQVEEKGPRGVTTDTAGNIYVCYWLTNEVAVLSKDLSQGNVIVSKRGGLSDLPQAILYDAVDHQLLVSNEHDSLIACFKLQ